MRRCRRWMHANPRTIQHVTVVKHSFMLRTILSVVTADLGIFRFLTLRSPSGILHPLVHEAQCKHHKPMVGCVTSRIPFPPQTDGFDLLHFCQQHWPYGGVDHNRHISKLRVTDDSRVSPDRDTCSDVRSRALY